MDKKVSEYQPKRELELFCYALVHQDVKGNKDMAERISGVDKGKFYWAYKTSKEFRLWFSDLCFTILRHNEAIPPYALMGAIIDKDIQAIRTYYELIGRLKHSNNLYIGQKNYVQIYRPEPYSREEMDSSSRASNRSI